MATSAPQATADRRTTMDAVRWEGERVRSVRPMPAGPAALPGNTSALRCKSSRAESFQFCHPPAKSAVAGQTVKSTQWRSGSPRKSDVTDSHVRMPQQQGGASGLWIAFAGQPFLRSARFLDDGLVHARSQSPFERRCDEPRGRRHIDIPQEPYIRPRLTRSRATWANLP